MIIDSTASKIPISYILTQKYWLAKEGCLMTQSLGINHSYKKNLVKYLGTNEFSPTDIYILESPNDVYMFEKSKAVEFLDELKQKYIDEVEMINDFGKTIVDLFKAIKAGEFNANGTMDFLIFMGAKSINDNDVLKNLTPEQCDQLIREP